MKFSKKYISRQIKNNLKTIRYSSSSSCRLVYLLSYSYTPNTTFLNNVDVNVNDQMKSTPCHFIFFKKLINAGSLDSNAYVDNILVCKMYVKMIEFSLKTKRILQMRMRILS